MIYAPVIVPTLCRYEHFKRLVESLQANPLAIKTDLFIVLDYPAKEEHWEGYRLIADYCENITGFNKVVITKRDHNCRGNKSDVLDYILNHYEGFIFTEDDNVFSPNFLEYIDKGLEKFKHDKSVLAILGYRPFYNIKFKDNNYYFSNVDFHAWGYGMWCDRRLTLNKEFNRKLFVKALFNPFAFFRVARNGWRKLRIFFMLLFAIDEKFVLYDTYISEYMSIKNMRCVNPTISKVRNEGWDNSGLHCNDRGKELEDKHMHQQIDDAEYFDYAGDGMNYFKHNHNAYVNETFNKVTFKQFITFLPLRIMAWTWRSIKNLLSFH